MAKKEPTLSWQVLLDDAQWEKDAPAPITESRQNRSRRWSPIPRRWLILAGFVLVVAIASAGFLLWQRAQNGGSTGTQGVDKKTPPYPSPVWGGNSSLVDEMTAPPPAWGRLGGGKI